MQHSFSWYELRVRGEHETGEHGMRHKPALDGLRALAITAVVSVHTFGWPANGFLGVDLFFVLSGFLITTLLLNERSRTGQVSLRGFWRRRAYRLVPALAVMLAIMTPLMLAAGQPDREVALGAIAGVGFFTNIALISDFKVALGYQPLWTLAMEEQFYLLWPLLLFLVLRARRRAAMLLLVAAAGAIIVAGLRMSYVGNRGWISPDARGLGIVVGCLVAIVADRAPSVGRLAGWLMAPALAGCAALSLSVAATPQELYRGTLVAFVGCAAVLVVGAADGESWVARALSIRPLVFVGGISYALYLWNLPLLDLLRPGHEGVALCLAVLLAVASTYLVERPISRRARARASARTRKEGPPPEGGDRMLTSVSAEPHPG